MTYLFFQTKYKLNSYVRFFLFTRNEYSNTNLAFEYHQKSIHNRIFKHSFQLFLSLFKDHLYMATSLKYVSPMDLTVYWPYICKVHISNLINNELFPSQFTPGSVCIEAKEELLYNLYLFCYLREQKTISQEYIIRM